MILLIASMIVAETPAVPFPERTPALIEACLTEAVEASKVDVTKDSHKYICSGQSAERLWAFLEDTKIESYVQDAGDEGHWRTREFPLGGCFKRSRMADGSPATTGLSCTIWIPRIRDR